MLQDRLTEKFLAARTALKRTPKAKPTAAVILKEAAPTAVDLYSRGRQLPSSIWI